MTRRLLEISKRILEGFKRNGDMIVTLETVEEFQAAIVAEESLPDAIESVAHGRAKEIVDWMIANDYLQPPLTWRVYVEAAIVSQINAAILAERAACVVACNHQCPYGCDEAIKARGI
jgi:hypothetical protein